MLTRTEAERLAGAINQLRPDWPVPSLLTFLGKHKNRPLLDIALELTFVALDPETKVPARVNENGPWKHIQHPLTVTYNFPAEGEACVECGQTSERHHAPAYADHPWTNRPQPAPKPEETP